MLVGSAVDESGVALTLHVPDVAMVALSTVVVPASVRSQTATPLPSVASATRRPEISPAPAFAPEGVATGVVQSPAPVALVCSITLESSQNALGVPLTMATCGEDAFAVLEISAGPIHAPFVREDAQTLPLTFVQAATALPSVATSRSGAVPARPGDSG